MLYSVARPIARYVLRYYYRHIDLSGLENIPATGPVILAANHPTAFIEPCILACFQPRKLKFLARGNLFWHPLGARALNALGILPVFRLKDAGYGRLKENFDTFSACHAALARGEAIMILAEGSTEHEKRLRPLRKGTARVALGALAAYPEIKDIPIVPVGVNFTHPERMRSTVRIRCGKPMSTRRFLADYRERENRGIKRFTDELRTWLSPLVVQVPHLERDDLAEAIFTLDRTQHREPLRYGISHDGEALDRELSIARNLPEGEEAARAIRGYFHRLYQLGVSDAAVAGLYREFLKRGVFDGLRLIPAGLILLWHLPLWALGEYIGGISSRDISFYSPVRFAAITIGMLVYPLLWLIGLNPWLITYALISILGVRWAFREWEDRRRWSEARMAWRQPEEERALLRKMRKRATIFATKDSVSDDTGSGAVG